MTERKKPKHEIEYESAVENIAAADVTDPQTVIWLELLRVLWAIQGELDTLSYCARKATGSGPAAGPRSVI